MTVDPTDDCTFWYTTEYYQPPPSFNWRTRIGKFKFPGCGVSYTHSYSWAQQHRHQHAHHSPTDTTVPPTATNTAPPTNTPVPPSASPTNTLVVPTDTPETPSATPTACTLTVHRCATQLYLLQLYPLPGLPGHHQRLSRSHFQAQRHCDAGTAIQDRG